MNEKISVLVPIYNAEKYIKRCIESTINQTYKNIEIIAVDAVHGNELHTAVCLSVVKQDAVAVLVTVRA